MSQPPLSSPTTFGFIGPALGTHPGWVTTQGEILAHLFDAEGHRVHVSSARFHPVGRAVDHAGDLVRWRKELDMAVVSVFSGRAFALADEAMFLGRRLGIPTVAWLHGGALPEFGAQHPRWTRRVLRQADLVVAPTPFLCRWAEELAGSAAVIPNVLDLDDYSFMERAPLRPRLLWMRTFQELYDPGMAILTLALLRERGVDASLTMAGQDKGLLEQTRSLADDAGVASFVSFPGFATRDVKSELLREHDIFLNTNLVDNAPVTVLEAAASGLAIVSTHVGGIPDLLVDGESARLVPPGDRAAMAEAVLDLLSDPSKSQRQAAEARIVAERSSWPIVRDKWLHIAERITRY